MFFSQCQPYIRFASKITLKKYPSRKVVAYDYRLFYVAAGTVEITAGQSYALSVGSLLVVPPGVCYRIWAPEPVELLVLNFDCHKNPALGEQPLAPVSVDDFKPQAAAFLAPEDAAALAGVLAESNAAFACRPLQKIITEFKTRPMYYLESTALQLKLLLIELQRRNTPQGGSLPQRLSRLTDYIYAHLTNPLSNSELAAVANYHPYYLNRLMQRYNGQTLHSFVTQCRLNCAAEQLLYSSESIEQIGRACGFLNQAYFTACFKKQFGRTPSAYRKQNGRLL